MDGDCSQTVRRKDKNTEQDKENVKKREVKQKRHWPKGSRSQSMRRKN